MKIIKILLAVCFLVLTYQFYLLDNKSLIVYDFKMFTYTTFLISALILATAFIEESD